MSFLLDVRHGRAQGLEPMSTWSFVASGPDCASTSFRAAWHDLLAASDDPFMMYQSPEWFDLVRSGSASGRDAPSLAVHRDASRKIIGVVPLYRIKERCVFPLALGRSYTTQPKKMIQLATGRLLLPPGDRWFDEFFESLVQRHLERLIVEVDNVPVGGPMDLYLKSSPLIDRKYCVFEMPGRSTVHTIPLPTTYDEFLAPYSAKKRYNLRRQFRQLQERAKGGLELRRYESADGVSEFFNNWDRLSAARNTPDPTPMPLAGREDRTRRMADLGLFHSYILMDGTDPVAAWFAQRWGRVVLLDKTLHNHNYNAYSPGTCLLHMVVEQLIQERRAGLINLGYGYPSQESSSTNVTLDYASYWLIPRTWKSQVFQLGYTGFRRLVASAKAVLSNRNRQQGAPTVEA
jgi:hypothetical protein